MERWERLEGLGRLAPAARYSYSANLPSLTICTSLAGAAPLLPLLNGRGMMHTLPFAHGLEAFFAAALVQRSRAV